MKNYKPKTKAIKVFVFNAQDLANMRLLKEKLGLRHQSEVSRFAINFTLEKMGLKP